MRLPKLSLKKLLLSAASLVALGVLGEIWARSREPGPFDLFDSNPYVPDPEVPAGWRHAPGFEGRWDGTWYSINRRGLRGPELEPTFGPGELRVVALGDSCTFGKGVLESECWPRVLETVLRARAPGRQVLVANLGHNGYSGRTYERVFKSLGAPLEPQVVVVGYNLNDFPNAIQAVDRMVFQERGLRRLLSKDLRDFLGRFALYRWARQQYYDSKRASDWRNAEAFARAAGETPPEVWEEQQGYLAGIRDEAARSGGHVAVFLFPYESQVYLDAYDSTPIDKLRATCAELGLPFFDLAEDFRRRARASDPPAQLFLKGDRYHPNPLGYRIVAERVAAVLAEHGWLASEGQ